MRFYTVLTWRLELREHISSICDAIYSLDVTLSLWNTFLQIPLFIGICRRKVEACYY